MLRLPGFVVSIGVMRLEKRGSMAVSLSDVISASETGSNHCPGRPAPRLIQTLRHEDVAVGDPYAALCLVSMDPSGPKPVGVKDAGSRQRRVDAFVR